MSLWLQVELAAGASALALAGLVVRYLDGTATRNYAYSAAPLPDGAPASTMFHPTWVRGRGVSSVMESGDLVEIHFNLVAGTPAERTDVAVTLVPDTGATMAADFKTPATYSTDTVITLR